MDPRTARAIIPILIFLTIAAISVIEREAINRSAAHRADSSIHLIPGNPSNAVVSESKPDNYLLCKPYFALSYNNSKGTPNWVSWCLREEDFGPAPRAQFAPDPDLPRSLHRVFPRDYNGGGFDRGHMCPRSDRTSSNEAAEATFTMTNVIPQSPNCNQYAWNDLEEYCRELVAKKHHTLYIIAGPQGVGGEGTKGFAKSIGAGRITVPAKCWKVILDLPKGAGNPDDMTKVNRDTRLIAVIMPNDQSVGHGWWKYRTSVQEVEKLTGYHFFDKVPAAIIGPLKERVDHEYIPAPHHSKRTND